MSFRIETHNRPAETEQIANMADEKKLKEKKAEDVSAKNDKDGKGGGETVPGKPASKRGRPAKEPPPPKLWRLEGRSPEGMCVTLGRYVTKEEAEPDLERLADDGFYEKLKITKSKE